MLRWGRLGVLVLAAAASACGGGSPADGDRSPGEQNGASTPGAVQFAFPLRDRTAVKGLVAFGYYDVPHNGIDFRPHDSLARMEVVAPASGSVTAAGVVEFGGLRHVQVNVTVDSQWAYALVFEPMTRDASLFDRQVAAVSAKAGDRITTGGPVGALLLGGRDGPPTVHFLVTRGSGACVCPYKYSTAAAQADYAYIASHGTDNHLPNGKFCVVDEIPNGLAGEALTR